MNPVWECTSPLEVEFLTKYRYLGRKVPDTRAFPTEFLERLNLSFQTGVKARPIQYFDRDSINRGSA
jgi:hypothetical protein